MIIGFNPNSITNTRKFKSNQLRLQLSRVAYASIIEL